MSRWCSTLSFDGEPNGESGEYRKPFRYAENREPDEDGRAGHFMLAKTRWDSNHDKLAPFVRVSLEGVGYDSLEAGLHGVDVVLDEAHVRELHGCLGEWIGRLR